MLMHFHKKGAPLRRGAFFLLFLTDSGWTSFWGEDDREKISLRYLHSIIFPNKNGQQIVGVRIKL